MSEHTTMYPSPAVTAATLERARVTEAAAHEDTRVAITGHVAALIRHAFPTATGLSVAFPRLESDGLWDAVLAVVWAMPDDDMGPADHAEACSPPPPCEHVLYHHQAPGPPPRLAIGPDDWREAAQEIEHLLTELAGEGALWDWEDDEGLVPQPLALSAEDAVGDDPQAENRRYRTLADLVDPAEG